jgi:hypothetical protein
MEFDVSRIASRARRGYALALPAAAGRQVLLMVVKQLFGTYTITVAVAGESTTTGTCRRSNLNDPNINVLDDALFRA